MAKPVLLTDNRSFVSADMFQGTTSGLPTSSANELAIRKINKLNQTNFKINGFIGRRPSSTEIPLPASQSNEKWASIDILEVHESAPFDPERIHLVIDCNSSSQMSTIQGLFDTLVVDLETTKSFVKEDTLDFITSAIKPGGRLVLPSEFKWLSWDENIESFATNHFSLTVSKKKDEAYEAAYNQWSIGFFHQLTNGNVKQDPTVAHADLIQGMKEYKDWISKEEGMDEVPLRYRVAGFLQYYSMKSGIIHPGYEEERSLAREQTKTRLLQEFDNVEICYKSYPYPNRYDNDGELPTYYFNATGRKSVSIFGGRN